MNGTGMRRYILLEETVIHGSGFGPAVALGPLRGGLIVATVGITRIIPYETIEVSLWGSSDGHAWGARPLATFPRKSYCGLYSTILNLSAYPDVEHVRAAWTVESLGARGARPMFGACIYVEESGVRCVRLRTRVASEKRI
jgi:hypothetical protein